jgi:methyl-accepting chemotaxis protein
MNLLLQLAAATDTVLVRNVPPVRSAFEQVVFVASGLTSILLLVLVLVLVVGLVVLRAKADAVQAKLDTLIAELSPMARHATAMSAEVREVAKNVNEMVAESRATVTVVNDRVRRSVVKLTDQVDDLSDMVGRVNASASKVANVASTAMAGLKVGASALGLGKKRKKPRASAEERPRLRRRD